MDRAAAVGKLFRFALAVVLCAASLFGAELRGHITFGGLPLPGATVRISQGDKSLATVSDAQGIYSFPDVSDGAWHFQVEMLCFTTISQDLNISASLPGPDFEMKLLPLSEIEKAAPPAAPPPPAQPAIEVTQNKKNRGKKAAANTPPANGQAGFQRTDVNAGAAASAPAPAAASDAFSAQSPSELSQRASDGLLVNGSSVNGASSPFSQSQAFGNNRRGPGSLYNGSLGLILDNSALDARTYSLTGQNTPKPAYDHLQGVATFGGPLRLPHLHFQQPPFFFVAYQWMRNRTDNTTPGLMPTAAERMGILPNGVTIPQSLISPQAQALLSLYPMPNFTSNGLYNYQTALVSLTNQNSLQSRFNKTIGTKNQLAGNFAFRSNSSSVPNLFQFIDKTSSLGLNTGATWTHRFNQRVFATFGYTFSRSSTTINPYWSNRQNISGDAGIQGNDQSSLYWGPPALTFSSGIQSLTDGNPASSHNQTSAISNTTYWYRSPHTVSFGGDFKRLEFNSLSEQNPRGAFAFTGAAEGSDLADFLMGIPDSGSIAFGNADKYFRTTSLDAFINDDWRVSPGLTINGGVRWEYSAPITELYGRLVNLDVAGDFSAVSPVVASSPLGSLTGIHYPDSLLEPDKHAFQPRIGFSWRPFPASSTIVRGGYGVYYNTSIYQTIANQMAQQPPLSKTFSLANTAATPLTLANGFNAVPVTTANTFGIDPNFKVGYAQNWQLSVQRDLPGGMVVVATYLGIKGTRAPQEFLPNTYPIGGVNPCPLCPSGFAYETSNGTSTREAGQLQLRRRLHAGLTASLEYTYAKAIDDAALGGGPQGQTAATAVIAQNWLNLSAERGLSNFDQRHLINATWQYSTGQGIGGGTLLSGWRGRLLKEWTFTNQINAGTGLPLTPILLDPVPGTGMTNVLRPEYTGAPLYSAAPGFYVNSAAFVAPPPGQFGNTGRDTITGPIQFSFNASMARTFRLNDRFNLDLRVDSANAINHVTFQSYNTLVSPNNMQFGFPTSANGMRDLSTTLRLRF